MPAGEALHEGEERPGVPAKLAVGAALAVQAREAGLVFRAVAAGSACGDQDDSAPARRAGLPFVMVLKPRRGTWAYGSDAHTPVGAARALAWGGREDPRRLAAGDPGIPGRPRRDLAGSRREAGLVGTGRRPAPGGRHRRPGTLPGKATWYLVTSLPRPGGLREAGSLHPAAGLAEIRRICGLHLYIPN